jgi:Protein of unknown function (DUF3159)
VAATTADWTISIVLAKIPHPHLPSARGLVRHAWPHVLEGSLAPFVLFAIAIRLTGLMTALVVALGWSVAALVRRLVTGKRVSGLLILSTLTLSARTVFALVSGNLSLYFLPPLVTTALLAGAFIISVPLGRPLTWRLANDLFPLPAHAIDDPVAGQAFRRMCWMWAGVNVSKVGINLWLLASLPVASYAIAKGLVSFMLMGGAIAISFVWVRRATKLVPVTLVAAPLPVLVTAA